MTFNSLVLRYFLFAALATMANLLTQRCVLLFGNTAIMFIFAVGSGTLIGLILKYILDKRWIFGDNSSGFISHAKKFSFYSTIGILTTSIFWTFETVFWLIWQTELMREIGAVIGLSIGYLIKYCLDSRYVFSNPKLEPFK